MKKTMIILTLILALGALIGLSGITVAAPLETDDTPQITSSEDIISLDLDVAAAGVIFAKYDGIDGESDDDNHVNWINVLLVDWRAHTSDVSTELSRRRGSAIVEDLVITVEYDKASPKLQEKCLKGEVIPKLEIEQTATYGGARTTYLKYELKNVRISNFQISAAADSGPPTMVIGNNFEEIKVTYTEYDDEGNNKGNVEYSWKVEPGA